MAQIVNQQTLIPVGLAVVLIGTVASWVSGVRSDMESAKESIELLKKNNEATVKLTYEINSRLSRIEWSLYESTSKSKK